MRKALPLIFLLLAFSFSAVAQTATSTDQNTIPTASTTPAAQDAAQPQNQMPPDQPANTSPAMQNNVQSSQPVLTNRNENMSGPFIASGTEIQATLDTPLSTKTSKVGDRFSATVNQPVRDNTGNIAVPSGAKINGQVSESEEGKTLAALRGKGRLNLRFTDIQLPNGTDIPVSATLVSVHSTKGGQTSKPNNEGEVQGGISGKQTAKDVGIGAGIGTIAGLLFGSALKGLAIGAAAGGGYVLATKGKNVELPAQTGMLLRVDHNASIPASGGGGGI